MSEVKVHLIGVEGEAERSVTETTTIGELFAGIFGQDRSAIAARVNGELRDLSRWSPTATRSSRSKASSEDGRAIIRHSTAHVLAQAVQDAVPGGQARHRPAGRERLLLRLRRRRRRSPRRT